MTQETIIIPKTSCQRSNNQGRDVDHKHLILGLEAIIKASMLGDQTKRSGQANLEYIQQ